jgi:hypothetical protein
MELCQVLRVGIRDVGEDASLGGLLDEPGIGGVEEDDHRAGGLVHDLLDQTQRMAGALAQADERDVRSLPRRHRPDVFDVDLARDHLVPKSGDDRCDESQPILALVGDQHAQMLCVARAHGGLSASVARNRGPLDVRAQRWALADAPCPKPQVGQSLPAPTLGRRGASTGGHARNASVRSRRCPSLAVRGDSGPVMISL